MTLEIQKKNQLNRCKERKKENDDDDDKDDLCSYIEPILSRQKECGM